MPSIAGCCWKPSPAWYLLINPGYVDIFTGWNGILGINLSTSVLIICADVVKDARRKYEIYLDLCANALSFNFTANVDFPTHGCPVNIRHGILLKKVVGLQLSLSLLTSSRLCNLSIRILNLQPL